jgi:Cu/Zn superoxide dismutase
MRLSRSLILPAVAGVLAMAACDDDDPVSPTTETATATLTAMNGEGATGTATISLTGDQFVARVVMTGTDTSLVHRQHIHAAAACPTAAADTNSDGFIDVLEGLPFYGAILVPLDGDISSQSAGATTFPSADSNGEYIYADTASFATMLDDLTDADPDPNDPIVKLTSSDLDVDSRTVVIHGVADTTTLPATVLSLPGLTPQQSLPVACGTIN